MNVMIKSYAFTPCVVSVFMIPPALWMVHSGRQTSREYIERLDEMKRSYDKVNEDGLRLLGEKLSEGGRRHIEQRVKDDDEWHRREVHIQREWLARPFYRQFWLPPFPDFADVRN